MPEFIAKPLPLRLGQQVSVRQPMYVKVAVQVPVGLAERLPVPFAEQE